MAAFAWDAEGERLAVALEPSEQGSTGRIAIFATSYKPILAMRLLGFAAEKPGHPAATAPNGAHRLLQWKWMCPACRL